MQPPISGLPSSASGLEITDGWTDEELDRRGGTDGWTVEGGVDRGQESREAQKSTQPQGQPRGTPGPRVAIGGLPGSEHALIYSASSITTQAGRRGREVKVLLPSPGPGSRRTS